MYLQNGSFKTGDVADLRVERIESLAVIHDGVHDRRLRLARLRNLGAEQLKEIGRELILALDEVGTRREYRYHRGEN